MMQINVCIIDADNTYRARDISDLRRRMGDLNMVVGERRDDEKTRPKDQLIAARTANKALSLIFGD